MAFRANLGRTILATLLAFLVAGETSRSASAQSVEYRGIDVSAYQGDIDWDKVSDAGVVFAFAKATEGAEEVDPRFSENWTGIKDAAIVRGAYHFFDPEESPVAQAEHFISTVRLEPGDLPPMLDIEVSDELSPATIAGDIRVWLERVAQAYGVKPIIYSDLSFIEAYLSRGFSGYPLLVAAYAPEAPPAPGDWAAWTF